MADETNITPAPAPAPAPEPAPEATTVEPPPLPEAAAPVDPAPVQEEVPADAPPVAVSDEAAFAAAKDPTLPVGEVEATPPAAPGEVTSVARKAKFPMYKDLATGDVYPALRTPAGYEDDHPSLYEGVAAKGD